MKRQIFLASTISGFSGMVIQMLLLRELLVVFHGNDLSIGIILANWLILEASGVIFASWKMEHNLRKINLFIGLAVLLAISSPIILYFTRGLRDLIGVMPGVGIGVFSIFYSSLLIFALPAFLHGALFVTVCRLWEQLDKRELDNQPQKGSSPVGKVYVWETLGHIIGAVIFTFVLILYFSAFEIVLTVSVLIILASIGLILCRRNGKDVKQKISIGLLLLLLVTFFYMIIGNKDDLLCQLSVSRQWPGKTVVHHQHSAYGNIAVIERESEYTFLADGIPIFTTPNPDIVRVEEFSHFAMLAHPKPETIAVLTGGAGGVIYEILKHPTVSRVDYTELDPLILEMVRKFSTPLTAKELADSRVNTVYLDGRRFLELSQEKYDVIFIGLPGPDNLAMNRYFVEEFFELAKTRLNKDGILVFSLPGSLSYLSSELRNLNGVIINTLTGSFPYLRIIPGHFNMYLASTSDSIMKADASLLYTRKLERELDVRLISYPHFQLRLAPRWMEWFSKSMQGATRNTNSDFQPRGFFYSLAYWNAKFSPYLQEFFNQLGKLSLKMIVFAMIILNLFILALRVKAKKISRHSIPFSVATTGFAGMVFDLIIIFLFQVIYGSAFHWLALLVAAFMVGVAVGGFVMTKALKQLKNKFIVFRRLELAVVIFSFVLPLILWKVSLYSSNPLMFILGKFIFGIMSFLAGTLVGLKFPFANELYLSNSANLSRTVGVIYSADLLGGWAGGIIVGVILFPVLGLWGTMMTITMIKLSSYLFLILP